MASSKTTRGRSRFTALNRSLKAARDRLEDIEREVADSPYKDIERLVRDLDKANEVVRQLRERLVEDGERYDKARAKGREYYEECLRLRGYIERVREVDRQFVLVPSDGGKDEQKEESSRVRGTFGDDSIT
jgi:chromosome segregation ATPase